ncbi:MAG: beta-propeller fold lactonase family protein [Planctomycetes bacterium]|nr:beta-propeller fold lactonase family protein [Planctomycetota bacterium]
MRYFSILAACIVFVTGCAASGGQVFYVSVGGAGVVATYDLDSATGAISRRPDVAVGKDPGPIAISADGKRLYVAARGDKTVVVCDIDPATGTITPRHTTPLPGSAPFIAIDPTGRYLLAAYYTEGMVSVNRIDDDGNVVEGPVQVVKTDKNAHATIFDASGKFLFVPHTGPNAVYQFKFDPATGMLSPNDPPMVHPPDGAGPRHMRFHPKLDRAYTVNELGSSVTCYTFDRAHGTLTPMQTLTTLPGDFQGKNTCAEIHLSADARFLYASNRGHDSLAVYAINAFDGSLRFIERVETEAVPRGFAIDLEDRYVAAVGEKSGGITVYRRDERTGRLTSLGHAELGPKPNWVTFYRLH